MHQEIHHILLFSESVVNNFISAEDCLRIFGTFPSVGNSLYGNSVPLLSNIFDDNLDGRF